MAAAAEIVDRYIGSPPRKPLVGLQQVMDVDRL
jgi:hypothetical protein